MNGLPLYELTHQLAELQDLATSAEIEPEALADALEAVEGDITTKVTSIAAMTRNLEAMEQAIREAGKAMLARADRLERRRESISAYVLFHLQAADIRRIETPQYVIRVQNNPPSVVIDDEAALPEQFMVTPPPPPPRPDKVGIREALKAGEAVPGAHLLQTQRLVISE